MGDERARRAWAVFDRLADVPPEGREAVLRAECGDDAGLRAEVERLLALDARLTARGRGGRDASDADAGIAARLRTRFAAWPRSQVVDTAADLAVSLEEALRHLGAEAVVSTDADA